jgi:hypothetical protein
MWLASKPADETFDWNSITWCACGQYKATFFSDAKGWSANPALTALNMVAFVLPTRTFGKLYEAMRGSWGL